MRKLRDKLWEIRILPLGGHADVQATQSHARTVVISVVAASVVAGPSAAAAVYVANADKVDNKHAVGSGATITARKDNLVATNPDTGLLPNNIIAKALDANKLRQLGLHGVPAHQR